MKRQASYENNPDATAGGKVAATNPPGTPVTILPKHLELFAQAIADGCNVREAAKRAGRSEGSGGYLNSRADVTERVAEIRSTMAGAAENDAATKMVSQIRSIDIDRNEIIMGLADIARYGKSEGARVSAWNVLAEIFLLKAKNLRDLNEFYGWTTDELERYAKTGTIPERLRRLIGSSLDHSSTLKAEKVEQPG
ncbi:MAG: hypothetical protein WBE44_11660 [Terriglobales bacterium]